MIDPKRMERLWAACPELRIARLFFEPSVMWGSWYRSGTGLDVDFRDMAHEDVRWLHGDEVEAMIRDRCSLWLAKEHGIHIRYPGANMDWEAVEVTSDRAWSRYPCFDSDDPTEACLLACERVLGLEPWEPANG